MSGKSRQTKNQHTGSGVGDGKGFNISGKGINTTDLCLIVENPTVDTSSEPCGKSHQTCT